MILLADANVLIDLGYVGGLGAFAALGAVEVLDVTLDECCHPRQPTLLEEIRAAGIQVVTVQADWLSAAQAYRQGPLSWPDALCYFYAQTYQRVLLTNEKPLRQLCQQEGIPVHGTLWLVHELDQHGRIARATLCQWLAVLQQCNRRLPVVELAELRSRLGCASGQGAY